MTRVLMLMLLTLPTIAMPSGSRVVGSQPAIITQQNATILATLPDKNKPKVVMLKRFSLTREEHQMLARRLSQPANPVALPLPESIKLGMNGTPVLDQGRHGTCTTFAVTAAIDALIGHGDYVSQLCALSLGKHLEQVGELPYSGWDGSLAELVLAQLFEYGIVPKSVENTARCGGLEIYPVIDDEEMVEPMHPDDYATYSESIAESYSWRTLLSEDDFFSPSYDSDTAMTAIKDALIRLHRVLIAVLLDPSAGGVVGAVGSHQAFYDTWMMTPLISSHAVLNSINAGHELIITGFDDNAVTHADDGSANVGLFKVRNSWGPYAGDHGDFYISYAYARSLIVEAHELILH